MIFLLLASLNIVYAEEQKTVYSDGYYYYHLEDGYISICGYFGSEEVVEIPSSIIALPVSRIETGAFKGCNSVKTIVLPETIMEVQENAFAGADNLSEIKDYTGTDLDDTSGAGMGNEGTDIPSANDGTPTTEPSDDPSNAENEAGEDEYIESNDEEQSKKENEENLKKIEEALNNSNSKTNISVNNKGNLVMSDAQGKESMIDDTHTYKVNEDGTILNEDGKKITVNDKNEVLDEDGNVMTKSSNWKIIALSMIIVIVIAGVVLLIVKKKK